MIKPKLPTVVIIGRINVGKSSLFNRLTETAKAIISEIPGTTRDYNISQVSWRKKTFNLIDTGGVNIDVLKHSIQALISKKISKKLSKVNSIEKEILEQTNQALQKADLLLFIVDGQAGLLPEDKELALVVKRLNRPTVLACNKIDSQKHRHNVSEFFKLGLGEPNAVSATNGSGSGDLLDKIVKLIKGQRGRPAKTAEKSAIKVAIVGKPNVGKSSLTNKILGEKRVIVSEIAQTTREPQDTEIFYKDQKIILIDTAGLRKKSRIEPGIEKKSTERTFSVIKKADVILFLTEVDKSLTNQDSYLVGLLKNSGAGIILVANKWDLLPEKDTTTDNKMKKYYQRSFPYLSFAPLIFISAKTGRNVDKILDLILEVWSQRQIEIPPEKLESVLKRLIRQKRPVKAGGQNRPHIYKVTQTNTNPPEFTITIGEKQSIHFSYLRFIENQIRKNFSFFGVPVKMRVKTLKH